MSPEEEAYQHFLEDSIKIQEAQLQIESLVEAEGYTEQVTQLETYIRNLRESSQRSIELYRWLKREHIQGLHDWLDQS